MCEGFLGVAGALCVCGGAGVRAGLVCGVCAVKVYIAGPMRGILCHSCNVCLGFVEDSQEVLSNMITYLAHGGQALRERVGL